MSSSKTALRVLFLIIMYWALPSAPFIMDTTDSSVPDLAELPLRIGSFNIQVFGRTKMGIPEVVSVLVKILSRYDLVQVLEIRDSSQTSFESLRQALNNYVKSKGGTYSYSKVESPRLGRTASKEQYGFLFRTDKINMTDTYLFRDDADVFEREPFAVRFNSPSTVVDDFVLAAIHIKPITALYEIGNLTKAYQSFRTHWNLENIIIAGDFNADCNYISVGELQGVSFRNDNTFYWAIPDNIDTSTQNDHCSYDKFVISGDSLIKTVLPGSAIAYRFDEEMSISNQDALRVSDHYPVEISLAGKPFPAVQSGIDSSIGFTVKDTNEVSNVNNIRAIYRTPSCAGNQFTTKLQREDTHMDFVTASMMSSDKMSLMRELVNFSKTCPGTLSLKLLATVDAYLNSDFLTGKPPIVYGVLFSTDIRKHKYETVLNCSLLSPYICGINISLQVSG